jgi:hypothetical protein
MILLARPQSTYPLVVFICVLVYTKSEFMFYHHIQKFHDLVYLHQQNYRQRRQIGVWFLAVKQYDCSMSSTAAVFTPTQ